MRTVHAFPLKNNPPHTVKYELSYFTTDNVSQSVSQSVRLGFEPLYESWPDFS